MEIIFGNRFKRMCDYVIDETSIHIPIPKKDKNLFFIKTDPIYVSAFFKKVRPYIDFPYKIITHNADYPFYTSYLKYLDDPLLIKWWSMNCYVEHPKLEPIPIGIANEIWPHGDEYVLKEVMNIKKDKSDRIYCNFSLETTKERQKILDYLKNSDRIDFETKKLNFKEYLLKLSSYKYVISPEGNGQDCHRIWEALYLGVIPIVKYHPCFRTFTDMPINFIESWDNIVLKEHIPSNIEKLDFDFYYRKIIDGCGE